MARTPSAPVTTRTQLIDAGTLLDVTRVARDHQIKLPCAISAAAWLACGGRPHTFATAGRKIAKTAFLASFYGQGPASLAANLGVDEDEARDVLARIGRAYPVMSAWADGLR